MRWKYLDILSLEQVLRTVPSGLFLVDHGRQIVYWNTEAERITGYSSEEAIGKDCSFMEGISCGHSCGLFVEPMPKPCIGILCSVKSRDGRRLILLKNVDYLRDSDGEIVGGVEAFVDVTHQKLLEERLRRHTLELEEMVGQRTAQVEEEKAQLLAVLDSMIDFAYICSVDHQVRFMNRAMRDAFGNQVGKICHQAFCKLPGPCEDCPMKTVVEGAPVCEERHFAGGRLYDIVHTPLHADGEKQKLAVFRDVTERKMIEEQLRETNRELDAFVYSVSHDLRVPLTPIIAFSEFLQTEYRDKLAPEVLDIVKQVGEQGWRMQDLLEDLLGLYRVGSLELPSEPVDTGKIVRQVLKDLSQPIIEGGIVVEVGAMPFAKAPESLLSEIFSNLIGNAIRYAGGQDAPIEVGGETQQDLVRFFVRDHGPGIPIEERERIFDHLYRGSKAKNIQGTGLGLAIVQKIARRLGGRAWLEETPGGGSTFWVEWPSGNEGVETQENGGAP